MINPATETADISENSAEPVETELPIEFRVNNNITYLNTTHFKSEEAKALFEKAHSLQKELDFSLQQMDELRKEYRLAKTAEEKKYYW